MYEYEEYGEVFEDKIGVFVSKYVKNENKWDSFVWWIRLVMKMRELKMRREVK